MCLPPPHPGSGLRPASGIAGQRPESLERKETAAAGFLAWAAPGAKHALVSGGHPGLLHEESAVLGKEAVRWGRAKG